MLRLISIEYFKLRNSRYFWLLTVLFLIFLLAVPISSKLFLDYLTNSGDNFSDIGITPNKLPVFDFVDIWQNLTWVYKSFSIFLGFIVVISVCSEFSYGTMRQNVIDGLSRREFLISKIGFIIALSLVFSLVVLMIGLLMGFLWSPVTEFYFIVKHIEFIPVYFLHLVAFQLFCLVAALLIKRSGIVIAILTFYVYVIENIAAVILQYRYDQELLAGLLPVQAIGNVIRIPFGKYILREAQTFVSAQDLVILIAYIVLLGFLSGLLVIRRDLA